MLDSEKINKIDILGLLVRNGVVSTHEYYTLLQQTSDTPDKYDTKAYENLIQANTDYINSVCNKQPNLKRLHYIIDDHTKKIKKLETGIVIEERPHRGVAMMSKAVDHKPIDWMKILKNLIWIAPLLSLTAYLTIELFK